MKENQFGLQAKTRQYGYVRFGDVVDRHIQKSKAGKLFQQDEDVLSVCVFDHTGTTHLYLKKDPVTKECVLREELA
jgi:hypothetical protein